MAGCALLITDDELLTYIGFATFEAMDTEVIRIIETPLMPGIQGSMEPNFLRNRCWIFTEKLCDISE